MQSLDVLFRRFIEEKQSQGLTNNQINRYAIIYNCFRQMQSNKNLENISTDTILKFYEKLRVKLRKAEYSNSNNTYHTDSTILACLSKLWSFFNWLKYKGYIVVNPFDDLNISLKNAKSSDNLQNNLSEEIEILRLIGILRHSSILQKRKARCDEKQKNYDFSLYQKQLNRIYHSFFLLTDSVFYHGIADYIQYISERPILISIIGECIILKSDNAFSRACEEAKLAGERRSVEMLQCVKTEYSYLIQQMQNSYWGAWFYLEIVYLTIHSTVEDVLKLLKDNIDSVIDYCAIACEMDRILSNGSGANSYVYFSRNRYSSYVNRVHNYILELLEERQKYNKEQESAENEPDDISFTYSQYGIPSGELIIKGNKPIQFVKMPATALYFFYSRRNSNQYDSYNDFNKFLGPENKQLISNEFRLLVESISKRVSSETAGVIKEIIVKQATKSKNKSANRYKWNKN